jgi:hypothetical protein
MQDLEQSFAARGIGRGGVLMLSAPDALAFIEVARQQQTPVLGVDSFVVTETATQPLMEHILDLSVGGMPADTWSEARRFIEQRKDSGFMFEIVV